MIVKEVVLPAEKQRIADFLASEQLRYEQNIDRTLYVESDDRIVGTVSSAKHIIKCLAVDDEFRGENLAVLLVSEIIKRMHDDGIYHYQVFTKPQYGVVFESLGFRTLVATSEFIALEGGDGSIDNVIKKLQVQIKFNLGVDVTAGADIGCVVINGNPFSNGHLQLVQYVSANHDFVLVFVVEEEASYFTFKERYAMAYLALKQYRNVLVVPSTKYIVSKDTFPGYFLKSVDETTESFARYDALLFRNYFMPGLSIKCRYVGTEQSDYMRLYNETLKQVLSYRLKIVPRFEENGQPISASHIRKLIAEGKHQELLELIPETNHAVLLAMLQSKNELPE